MKYALFKNKQYKGEIVYTSDLLEKERKSTGTEIWFLSDNVVLPKGVIASAQTNIYALQPVNQVNPYPFPNDIALQAIRNKRDALLAECDWTAVSDANLTEAQKNAWKAYRQELRDLPAAFADNPNEVVWPARP